MYENRPLPQPVASHLKPLHLEETWTQLEPDVQNDLPKCTSELLNSPPKSKRGFNYTRSLMFMSVSSREMIEEKLSGDSIDSVSNPPNLKKG